MATATIDIGSLGPRQSAAIRCEWKWQWTAIRLSAWLVPLLCVLYRRNRSPRALAAFIPAIALAACANLLAWPISVLVTQQARFIFAEILTLVAATLLAVWLYSGTGYSSRVTMIRGALVAAPLTVAFRLMISLQDPDFCEPPSHLLAITLCVIVPAYAGCLASLFSLRRGASPRRIIRWTCFGFLGAGLLLGPTVALFAAADSSGPSAVVGLALAGLFVALAWCVSFGVFLLFTCFSKQYRERWRADLPPAAAGSETIDPAISRRHTQADTGGQTWQ